MIDAVYQNDAAVIVLFQQIPAVQRNSVASAQEGDILPMETQMRRIAGHRHAFGHGHLVRDPSAINDHRQQDEKEEPRRDNRD